MGRRAIPAISHSWQEMPLVEIERDLICSARYWRRFTTWEDAFAGVHRVNVAAFQEWLRGACVAWAERRANDRPAEEEQIRARNLDLIRCCVRVSERWGEFPGWTKIGQMLRTQTSTVSAMRKGARGVHEKDWARIAALFGVTLGQLSIPDPSEFRKDTGLWIPRDDAHETYVEHGYGLGNDGGTFDEIFWPCRPDVCLWATRAKMPERSDGADKWCTLFSAPPVFYPDCVFDSVRERWEEAADRVKIREQDADPMAAISRDPMWMDDPADRPTSPSC